MAIPKTSEEQVTNFVGHYFAGIVCPAVAWDYILDAVKGHEPADVFGRCPKGIQLCLVRLYLDRPGSLHSERDPARAKIEAWCLQRRPALGTGLPANVN